MAGRIVVDPRFRLRLRQLRTARGLSYRALGALVHYSHTYLWEVESGRKPVVVEIVERLDEALAAGGELLALAADDAVRQGDDGERLCAVVRQPRRVDPAAAGALEAILDRQRRLEDSLGAAPLLAPVEAQLKMVEDLVVDAHGPARRRLLEAGSQWAQFAGWLSAAGRHDDAAGRRYGVALEWATEAGLPNMVATALSMRGHLAWLARQPGPLIGLSAAAARQAVTPGVRSLALQQQARGHALLGEADECDRRLDEAVAQAAAAAEHPEDEPPWTYFFDDGYLTLQRGLAYRRLGRHAAALELLSAGLAALPAGVRGSGYVGQYVYELAVTHAASGDLRTAEQTLSEARLIAETTGSAGLAARVERLTRRLDA